MDLLPKVETEFIEEVPEPLKEELESDDDNVIEAVIEEAEPQLPEVEKKSSIPEEDIFVEKKTKKELTVEPVKPVKKKRVMTEAQLERLRIGREKGLAKRRALAAEKKELKELKSKKKKKEIQQLRDEVEDKPHQAPAPAPAPAPLREPAPIPFKNGKTLSFEDIPPDMLVKLQQDAIEGYDSKRRARKQKKKEEESKQSEQTHFRNMVQHAVQPPQPARYGEPGFFNHLW
jgi:hypothetical protein|tara:strand:+ start:1285 stop:1977 length:693 start_codon:yes stop_codon:yes gene_type:complete